MQREYFVLILACFVLQCPYSDLENLWFIKAGLVCYISIMSLFLTVGHVLVQSSSFHSWTITCVDCLSVWSLSVPLLLVGQTQLL